MRKAFNLSEGGRVIVSYDKIKEGDWFMSISSMYLKKCVRVFTVTHTYYEDDLGNHDMEKFSYKIIGTDENIKLEGVKQYRFKEKSKLFCFFKALLFVIKSIPKNIFKFMKENQFFSITFIK